MIAWNKEKSAHRAQHISKVFERRGDSENAMKWEGWKVGNLRPIFEPILWFMKPYKIGGTIADNLLLYEVGAYNESIVQSYSQLPNNLINFGASKILIAMLIKHMYCENLIIPERRIYI